MCIKKHLKMLEKALAQTYELKRSPLKRSTSLQGGEMPSFQEKSERVEAFERRLLELRQLSEEQRAQLREILRRQRLLSASSEKKGGGVLAQEFTALEARISELQQQARRIRKQIHAVSLLQSTLSHNHPP